MTTKEAIPTVLNTRPRDLLDGALEGESWQADSDLPLRPVHHRAAPWSRRYRPAWQAEGLNGQRPRVSDVGRRSTHAGVSRVPIALIALHWVISNRVLLLFAVAGMVPISSISATYFGILPLHVTFRLLTVPATAAVLLLGASRPAIGRLALVGMLVGMLATALFDVTRVGFIAVGLWSDYIPAIGRLALDDPHASPLWGYAYRYLYDGGFMGMTFAMIFTMVPYRATWALGLTFGVVICCCLFGTVVLAPLGEKMLFSLTPAHAAGALIGHAIYGSVLGTVVGYYRAPAKTPRWFPGDHTFSVHDLEARSG